MSSLTLKVSGMHCAHCARAVEKQLANLDGVDAAEAQFATGAVTIEFKGASPADDAIEGAVVRAGYAIVSKESQAKDPSAGARAEASRALFMLLLGVVLAAPVIVIHWTGPHEDEAFWDWFTVGIAVLLQGTVGLTFYRGAIASLRSRLLGMDVLVSIGMGSGLIYGLLLSIFNWPLPQGITKHIFFEAATLLVVFIRLGKYVEARARGQALSAEESASRFLPRSGASVTLEPHGNNFLCQETFSRHTIIASCPYG